MTKAQKINIGWTASSNVALVAYQTMHGAIRMAYLPALLLQHQKVAHESI